MMFASVFCVALFVPSESAPAPVWYDDYRTAMRRAEAEAKPLAVFIGKGESGQGTLGEEGELNTDVARLLADSYVCLYVNADRPAHRELAEAFEASALPTLVLSDRTRMYQAFRHSGTLDNTRLVRVLETYRFHEVPAPAPFEPLNRVCRT
jgi:hypothetical protein